ncbi:MAG: hypothetical protein ACOC8N_09625 [Spirochaetota bacterium]
MVGLGSADTLKITGRIRIIADAYLGWNLGVTLFMLLGMYFSFRVGRRLFSFFSVLIGAQLLFHALMSEWIWHHHLIVLLPVFSILAAFGMCRLVSMLRNSRNKAVRLPGGGRQEPRAGRRLLALASISLFILLAVIPNLAGNVYMHREHAGRHAYRHEKQLVRLIEEMTGPDDLVVSDELMSLFRTGRTTSGMTVDPSGKRIKTGSLREETLLALGQEPAMVIFWTGRLGSFHRYRRFVSRHYRLVYTRNDREVYLAGSHP